MADQLTIGGNLVEVAQTSGDKITVGSNVIEVIYSSPDDTVTIGGNLVEVALTRILQDRYKYQAFLI